MSTTRISIIVAALLASSIASWAQTDSTPAAKPRHEMTEQERADATQKADAAWQQLSLHEKMQMLKMHDAMKQMPPEERKFVRDRIEHFMHMSPEERQKLKENADRWRQMSPEERDKARELFKQRRQQFEEKWRKEHPGETPPTPPGPPN